LAEPQHIEGYCERKILGLSPEITVQSGKIIHTEISEQNTSKPDKDKNGHALTPPAVDIPRMQHNCVDKPGD
jgi:hypothetical protein